MPKYVVYFNFSIYTFYVVNIYFSLFILTILTCSH